MLPSRECNACGTRYQPRRRDSLSCSVACSSLAYQRANRAMLNEARRARSRTAAGLPLSATDTELRRAVARANRSGPVISYATAHKRVQSVRGKASDQSCVDCAGQADEWSYNHADPSPCEQMVRDTRSHAGDVRKLVYSLEPDNYDPRCHACHLRHDGARKPVAA